MRKVLGLVAGRVRPLFWVILIGFCLGFAGLPFGSLAWGGYQPGESADEPAPVADQLKSLHNSVSALEAEIEGLITVIQAMERRMVAMERELTVLRGGGGVGGGGSGPGSGSGTPGGPLLSGTSGGAGVEVIREKFADLGFPPDQPFSSPEAAYVEAATLYGETFKDLIYDTPRDKINYVRRVRQWVGRTDHALTGKIVWICELQNVETLQSGEAVITVQVVNPADSNDVWSWPHVIEISRRVATRLKRQRSSAGGALSYVKITGIFRLQQIVDDALDRQEIFEEPYLTGPFAIFQYEIEVNSLAPASIRPPAPGNGG